MNTNNYRTGYQNMNQGSYIEDPQAQQQYYSNYPQHYSSGGLALNNQQYYEPYEKPSNHATCLDVAEHATTNLHLYNSK